MPAEHPRNTSSIPNAAVGVRPLMVATVICHAEIAKKRAKTSR